MGTGSLVGLSQRCVYSKSSVQSVMRYRKWLWLAS